MAKQKLPFLKFYPSDWRGSTKIKLCSAGARALLVEMMCIMHDAEPYGHLLISGKPVTDVDLARQSGLPVKQIPVWRKELEDRGVIERRGEILVNTRMERDEDVRKRRAAGGPKGGNPTLMDKGKVNHKGYPSSRGEGYTHGDHQRPETRTPISPVPSVIDIRALLSVAGEDIWFGPNRPVEGWSYCYDRMKDKEPSRWQKYEKYVRRMSYSLLMDCKNNDFSFTKAIESEIARIAEEDVAAA